MEFEEVQMIWDAQNKQPASHLDREILAKCARMEEDRSSQMLKRGQLGSILILIVLGALSVLVADSIDLDEYMEVGITFGFAAFIYYQYRTLESRLSRIGEGLLGDIERSILRYRASMQFNWTFVWFAMALGASSIALRVATIGLSPDGIAGKLVLMIVGFSTVAGIMRLTQKKLEERKLKNLSALKTKLETHETI